MRWAALLLASVLAFAATSAQAVTASNPYGGPPPPHAFGPDSTSTGGPYTGQGTDHAGLTCSHTGTPVPMNVCAGYLASGVDQTLLDATVEVPDSPAGNHPLVAVMHGWGGSKTDDMAWDANFLADGYTVLRYSARGFGSSWGQTNLADQNVEIADMRSLIGQVVDSPQLRADGSRVAVIGASYGGGHSYQLAEKPAWSSPGGKPVTLKTAVPIVPWTSLYYSLEPNGRPHQTYAVPGSAKFSYVSALYAGGHRMSPARPYDSYPALLHECFADGTAEPSFSDPVYMTCLNALEGYRSVWESQDFWQSAKTTKLPILDVQGWTDDLFPVPEALRMYYALKSLDPGYPIALYLGNVGHPRAANNPAEIAYLLDHVLRPWFAYYLNGTGSAPAADVRAAITQPDNSFSPANVVEVPTYDALASAVARKHFSGAQTITFDPANTSGVAWDPVVMTASEKLQPNPLPAPGPDEVPGDVASYSASVAELTGGGPLTVAGAPAITLTVSTTAYREQLNARIFDVAPDGTRKLITRGTYTLDSGSPATPLGSQRLTLTTYGNLWRLPAADTLLVELTNVDDPYISPSKVASVSTLTGVEVAIPER